MFTATVDFHSQVASAFAFFFDLCHTLLETLNVKCEHHHLLSQNSVLTFDVNTSADVQCEQGLMHTSFSALVHVSGSAV